MMEILDPSVQLEEKDQLVKLDQLAQLARLGHIVDILDEGGQLD
jgi:hypothetical protein